METLDRDGAGVPIGDAELGVFVSCRVLGASEVEIKGCECVTAVLLLAVPAVLFTSTLAVLVAVDTVRFASDVGVTAKVDEACVTCVFSVTTGVLLPITVDVFPDSELSVTGKPWGGTNGDEFLLFLLWG